MPAGQRHILNCMATYRSRDKKPGGNTLKKTCASFISHDTDIFGWKKPQLGYNPIDANAYIKNGNFVIDEVNGIISMNNPIISTDDEGNIIYNDRKVRLSDDNSDVQDFLGKYLPLFVATRSETAG